MPRSATPNDRPLQVGDRAPAFALRQGFETVWTLDRLTATGPAVLAFYVFDFGHY